MELDNLVSRPRKSQQIHTESDNSKVLIMRMDSTDGDTGVNSLATCNVRWSERSLDNVSQLSPEMDMSSGDEMSGLLADV